MTPALYEGRLSDGLVFVSGPLLRPSLLGRVEAARPVRSAIEWRSSPSGEYLQPTVELLLRGVDARLATRLGDRGAATMLDSDPVDPRRGRIALYLGDDPDRILELATDNREAADVAIASGATAIDAIPDGWGGI